MSANSMFQSRREPHPGAARGAQQSGHPPAPHARPPRAGLIRDIVELWQQLWSPGLANSPTITSLEIRNGGQHRF